MVVSIYAIDESAPWKFELEQDAYARIINDFTDVGSNRIRFEANGCEFTFTSDDIICIKAYKK